MTFLAPKLRERIEIREAVQTPNDTTGGMDRSYNTITTIWAGIKPVSMSVAQAAYIRGEQVEEVETHIFTVRRTAVSSLGRDFSKAFAGDFDSIEDLSPVKTNWFIFLRKGSANKGRLFKIHRVMDKEERREYLLIMAEEIEEHGTGCPE